MFPQKKKKVKKEINQGIEIALSNIEKKLGKFSIMKLGSKAEKTIGFVPSGSIALDSALGIGGYAKGRIVEIAGKPSGGKTTLALQAIATAQDAGLTAAFIDAENAMDIVYASAIGVDVDELLFSQPDCGEEGLEIVEELVRGGVGIIVVDSVAALVPKAEIEGEMGDQNIGLQARMMGRALRKLTTIVSKTNCCLIFINQIRDKIGGGMFGPKTDTPGGNALKFFASQRLEINRVGSLKNDDEAYGNRVRVKLVKNKVAPPFRECEFNIIFGDGIDQIADLIECGVTCGVIEKKGSWFNYKENRIGQGIDGCRKYFSDYKNFEKIRKEVMKNF